MDRNQSVPNLFIVVLLAGFITFVPDALCQQPQKEPQQPEDVVRVYTDLVQTDVMVFDKRGHFVNGLKREDFSLRIDGKPQPIEFFESVAAGSAREQPQVNTAIAPALGGASPPAEPDRGRTILFYVDDLHLSAGDLVLLRKALLKFIDDDLGQNDEAVVTSASGEIGFLQQLTDNKAVLRKAVSRIKAHPYAVQDHERPLMTEYQAMLIDANPAAMSRINEGLPDLLTYFVMRTMAETGETREAAEIHVRNRARSMLEQGALVTSNTLSAFEGLVKSAAELPGRKLAFFVSDGFLNDTRNSDVPQRLEQIIRTAARNGVIVYSMDSRGLTTGLPTAGDPVEVDPSGVLARESHGELLASREAMATLAVDTGGRTIFDTNALDVALAKAAEETSLYYLLTWRLNHESQTSNKPPRIEVSLLNHPELTVRLRKGFMATPTQKMAKGETAKPDAAAGKSLEAKLRDALTSMYPRKDLPLALDLQFQNTSDKGTLLTASMQVPIDSISTTTADGKPSALVNLGGFVYDDQGKVKGKFNQQGTVTPASQPIDGSQSDTLTFNYSLPLPPGLYQVRAGAQDINTGRTGTVHDWIEIPDLSAHELRLSTILAGERVASNSSGQPSGIIMRANHIFRRDASLRFQLYVFNASVAAGESKPDLEMQLQVLRNRQPVITIPVRQIALANSPVKDQIRTGGEFSLKDLAPGRYVLLIAVMDSIAKATASQEMRFEIR